MGPENAPDEESVGAALSILAEGGLVALPTETVYGLAARADDPSALARLVETANVGGARSRHC